MSQTMNEDLNVIANSDLEITYLDGDLSIIQQLDDEPNDVGGLTSAQLKAKFDQAGLAIQSYLNNTLIPELLAADATESARAAAEAARETAEAARAAAEAARVTAEENRESTTTGIVAQATQAAQQAAASAEQAAQTALGTIPDGSIAKVKLVEDVQSILNRAANCATLGADGKVPSGQIPSMDYVPTGEKGQADGVATLGADGVLTQAQRPTVSGIKSDDGTKTLAELLPDTVESADHPGCYYRMVDGVTEWLNPPMNLGVEYRTTERYLGKPVYVKIVDFGALPNHSVKSMTNWTENASKIVRHSISLTNGGDVSGYSEIRSLFISYYEIQIQTVSDQSAYQAYVVVYYTKSTD